MTALVGGWQEPTAAAVVAAAAGVTDGLGRALVVGSCARTPGGADALSDLDLALVVPSADEALLARLIDPAWLAAVGPVWAYEQQPGELAGAGPTGRRVLRAVFADGRRVDLLLQAVVAGLPEPRRELPVPSASAVDPMPTAPMAEAPMAETPMPTAPAAGTPAVETPVPDVVNQARFDMALAIAKLGRADLLIGAHLALQVVRHTLVASMLLRDREQGTTVHHTGTDRDRDATAVSAALAALPAAAGAADWLDLLERIRGPFDAAAGAVWPRYAADWRAADVLTATARAARSAAIGSTP